MRSRLLHVWVLWAFAVAQPIYDVIRRNGEFFVAHEADRLDLILLTITLSLLLPGGARGTPSRSTRAAAVSSPRARPRR